MNHILAAVNATSVHKLNGQWKYLYRAVDKEGNQVKDDPTETDIDFSGPNSTAINDCNK
ncbi:MAG TPA: hypothetical protein VE954_38725 [Oligoflexus sp.]|uniref:hypothetical protein n=1 Tax=Oligoflexus sp. TaxID=1971216 RepID=UPI002D7456F1|nr:hypothetical protein [Oligoflexus sp.]HYX39076.1 hypothetical protein [Oligoflexus sp.]